MRISSRILTTGTVVRTVASAACLLGLSSASGPAAEPPIRFQEMADQAGVLNHHTARRFGGEKGQVLEMFTSGGASVAVADVNNDGWEDLLVTNAAVGADNRLFLNRKGMRFEESDKSAVSAGNDPDAIVSDALFFDYDNDGWQDLILARFGTPLLFHNDAGKDFRDVSAQSGFRTFQNSVAVITLDYDIDGDLDVLFGNYFKAVNLHALEDTRILPDNLDDANNGGGVSLWRNEGRGRFVDVTNESGLADHTGWTLDLGHGDFDRDGHPDLYLACDFGTDRLFRNNGDGTFTDRTIEALGGRDTKKGMNAEIGDYDNDGWLDVYVTNITDEYMKECNMLWHNNGDGTFTDVSRETGTCDTRWGWAAKFADFDNDGWLDIFAVDGMRSAGKTDYIPTLFEMIVTPNVDFSDVNSWPDIGDKSWSGYQKSRLFRNRSGQLFEDIAPEAGVDNDRDGRGVVVADFDRDGRVDIYQTNMAQPSLFYRNLSSSVGHWIALQLVGTDSNRDAVGARVTVRTGHSEQVREVSGGNGYSGQSSKILHFGLGPEKSAEITVRWPSGLTESTRVPIDQLTVVREGQGKREGNLSDRR